MTLIGHDEVEFLDGKRGVVGDGNGVPVEGLGGVDGEIVEVGCGLLFTLEHGIEALDRADDNAGVRVERVAGEVLDYVFLGELVVVHRRDELLELLQRLLAEVAAIHEEEHAFGSAVFDEAVDEVHRSEGLARAGGHLDKGPRFAGGERFLQARDGLDLRRPEFAGGQDGKLAESAGELLLLIHPLEECFGPMESEDRAASRFGIEVVGEAGFLAGGFVAKGQRVVPFGERGGRAVDVFGGLLLDSDEGMADRLGLHGAQRLAVHEERVVRFAGLEG